MWSRLHYRIAEPDDTRVLCKSGAYGKHMRSVFMSCVGWLPERMEDGEEEEVKERVCSSRLIHSQCLHWAEPGYRESPSIILQRKQLSHVLPAANIKPLDGLKAEETMCYEMSNKSMCLVWLSEIYSGYSIWRSKSNWDELQVGESSTSHLPVFGGVEQVSWVQTELPAAVCWAYG